MLPQRKFVWLGLFGRYLVLVAVLGLVATSLYATVNADDRRSSCGSPWRPSSRSC